MLIGGIPMVAGGSVLDCLQGGVPTGAWGLRRLSAAARNKCINVRRSSDNAAMDIGFRGNALDVYTLKNFVGSGNGFVTTWYNQGSAGSAGDATQTTASYQPKIVESGTLVTQNGLPAIDFNISFYVNLQIPAAVSPSGTTASYLNAVATLNNTANAPAIYGGVQGSGSCRRVAYSAASGGFYVSNYNATVPYAGTISTGSPFIITAGFPASPAACTYWLNGTNMGSSAANAFNTSSGYNYIGSCTGFYNWGGTIQELIQPLAALSTIDRQTIEHNQEAVFGISGV